MKYNFADRDFEGFRQLLKTPKKIVITTHYKPDGDAIGSSLGLYNFFGLLNHQVTVVSPSDYPEFLWWMTGHSEVINYLTQQNIAETLIAEADLIFCLDFNSPDRVEKMESSLVKASAIKILIDHHLDPKSFCLYNFSFPEAAATCELLYYFIDALGKQDLITRDIAECLYTGIMTDTGSFRFKSMTADLHRVIAGLIEKGARNNYIHDMVYDNYQPNRLKLLGFCINEKLQVVAEYHTAIISISEKELSQFNYQTGDTEGIVNYALGIRGIKLAAFFSQNKQMIKISFRSKGDFSVKGLAETHFNGGGHNNAAGGKSFLSLQQTVDKFLALLPGLNLAD